MNNVYDGIKTFFNNYFLNNYLPALLVKTYRIINNIYYYYC